MVGKEKAKLFLTWRKKSEILRAIFEVGYVSGFLRSIPRSNAYAVSLS
jgi:alpha-D-ribose 1-methylphosphonate 5-triphosphate synthase subunit PhnL